MKATIEDIVFISQYLTVESELPLHKFAENGPELDNAVIPEVWPMSLPTISNLTLLFESLILL